MIVLARRAMQPPCVSHGFWTSRRMFAYDLIVGRRLPAECCGNGSLQFSIVVGSSITVVAPSDRYGCTNKPTLQPNNMKPKLL
jgi:hypothetical protein